MATTDTKTTRIITLTNRPPIKIVDDDWDLIAEAKDFDGQVECQANRTTWLKVRRHTDGRVIVYGGYDTAFQSERRLRGGEVLAAGKDVVAAIGRVAETCQATGIAADCIADLPAEEI